MEEVWKDIKGYEGLYKISNIGRIMALSRRVKFGCQYRCTETKLLSPRKKGRRNPYLTIILYDKFHKSKTFHLHRLVALHFVDGYFDGADVNHKDGNKMNNIYTNLEWCSRSYNIKHSYWVLGLHRMKGRAVLQSHLNGEPICFYDSISEASRTTGICDTCIGDCARGKLKSTAGFIFSFF